MSTKEHNQTTLTEDNGVGFLNASGACESERSENSLRDAQKNETQTTNFNNDSEVNVAEIKGYKPISTELLSSAKNSKVQDIKDFLAKPYPYLSGNFSNSDTSATFAPFIVPNAILSIDLYKQKLKGHLGFRGELVLRLQVNANRFQQGRYILYYLPGVYSGVYNETFYAKAGNLTVLTQLPHVEIDLNCDTEAILRVPYSTWVTHFPLNSASDQKPYATGVVGIRPYSALVSSGGSSTAEFTLWTYFENVEFVSPALAVAEMNIERSKPAVDYERKSAGVSPLSSAAIKVSKTSKVLEKVPVLGHFAGMVGWASDIVANVASIWGYSNPIDLSPVHRMVQTIFPYANNIDAVDSSMPMAYYSRNEVETLPSIGHTGLDETSISYLVGIPSFYKKITITTSDDFNTLLWSQALSPDAFYQSLTDGSVSYRAYTPLGYLSNFFTYYRGSIGFKLKFVKTEFHSARLVLSFNPSQTSNPLWDVTDTPYIFREIIDLRYGNEFTFVIPYTSLKPYRNNNDGYGAVKLHVLNELKAPANVSTSIDLLIEPFAASDFEFAMPKSPNFKILATSAVSQMNSCTINSTNIGGSYDNEDSLTYSRACIGEKILSLNAMLKHSSFMVGDFTNTTQKYIVPDAIFWSKSNGSTVAGPYLSPDLYSFFTSMFAYQRGSLRFRAAYSSTMDSVVLARLYSLVPGVAVPPYGENAAAYSNETTSADPTVVQNLDFRKGVEVAIPFYNMSYVKPTQFSNALGADVVQTPVYSLGSKILNITTPTAKTLTSISRQTGDDFQLFTFNGVPSVIMNS